MAIGRLQFKGVHEPSPVRKSLMMVAFAIAITAAAWLMFLAPRSQRVEGNIVRQVILLACALVFAARVAVMLFVFLKRRIPWWESLFGCIFMPLIVFYFATVGGESNRPLNLLDLVGAALYVLGSYLSTASELGRHRWKRRPENRGRLYTRGLFARCRHINYFADIVLFTGFALITQYSWSLIVPLIMLISFVVWVVPAHDKYLADRYGEEFAVYTRRAKRLVPFVY